MEKVPDNCLILALLSNDNFLSRFFLMDTPPTPRIDSISGFL